MLVKLEETGLVDNQARKSPATEEKRNLSEIDISFWISELVNHKDSTSHQNSLNGN